jgi:spore coat polysaccharide biosynthesis predicted glycosyltransferase SpsG
MESTLFTQLTTNEEAIFSGGSDTNTAVAINSNALSVNTVQNAAAVANSGDRVGIDIAQFGVIRRRR